MRTRLPTVLTIAGLAAGVAASVASAVGPTPGFAPSGVVSSKEQVRYVAVPGSGTTFVKAVRVSDGRLLRSTTLTGTYGVPLVAYDGTAGGLTHDGKLLVLETNGQGERSTRFTVLATNNLRVQQSFALDGLWAYDALSPGGRTLYLVQTLSPLGTFRYLVRAYDLWQHRLVAGAIADKSEPGSMAGYPLSRVTSANGTWAYTLYQRTTGKPFIHALNTRGRAAVCIDLAMNADPNAFGSVRLTLSPDESRLVVRASGKAVLSVPAPR
jgi:hypothetical protein